MRVFELVPLKGSLYLRLFLAVLLVDLLLERIAFSLFHVPVLSDIIGAVTYLLASIFVFLITLENIIERRKGIVESMIGYTLVAFLVSIFCLAAFRGSELSRVFAFALSVLFAAFILLASLKMIRAAGNERDRGTFIMLSAAAAAGGLFSLFALYGTLSPVFIHTARYLSHCTAYFYIAAIIYAAIRLIGDVRADGINKLAGAETIFIVVSIATLSIASGYAGTIAERTSLALGMRPPLPPAGTGIALLIMLLVTLYTLFNMKSSGKRMRTALALSIFFIAGVSAEPNSRLAAIAAFSILLADTEIPAPDDAPLPQ